MKGELYFLHAHHRLRPLAALADTISQGDRAAESLTLPMKTALV